MIMKRLWSTIGVIAIVTGSSAWSQTSTSTSGSGAIAGSLSGAQANPTITTTSTTQSGALSGSESNSSSSSSPTVTTNTNAVSGSNANAETKSNATNAGNAQTIVNNTNVPNHQSLKTNPEVFAPGLTTTLTETCMGSSSLGVSVLGFGASGGTTWQDHQCVRRLNARELAQTIGDREAARELLCGDDEIFRVYNALGRPCRLTPRGQPNPAWASAPPQSADATPPALPTYASVSSTSSLPPGSKMAT